MTTRPDPNQNPETRAGDVSAACDFARGNLEALALGALDSFDRDVVEHHVRWCLECRAEADILQRVADSLPLGLPDGNQPDEKVWTGIRAAITGSDRPIAPVTTLKARAQGDPSTTLISRSAPHWAYVLVAPLAIALLVMSVWANSLKQDLDASGERTNITNSMNRALFGRSGVQLTTMDQTCPNCTGSGQLGYSETDRMGIVIGWNFDPTQQHDVWQVNRAGDRKRICQLHIDEQGGVMQVIQLPEAPSEYSDVIVTDADGQLIYVSHLLSPSTSGAAT